MSVTFNYVPVTDEQKAQMQIHRDQFQFLFNEIAKLPNSRGRSIALTKLEEASMWVNKSITGND